MKNSYFYAGEIQTKSFFGTYRTRYSGVETHNGTPEEVYKQIEQKVMKDLGNPSSRLVFYAFNLINPPIETSDV